MVVEMTASARSISGLLASSRRSQWGRASVGLGLGLAIGVALQIVARRTDRPVDRGLVDWHRAEEIATARLERSPGSLSAAELRRVERAYAEAMETVIPLLEQHLGAPLPGVVERHAVVSRADWARANLETFRTILERLEPRLLRDLPNTGFAAHVSAQANRFVATRQIAWILALLGRRVLGQYDIAILSAEAAPGRLLFVEENIRGAADALGLPRDAFRTWIALHEATHAFEMEAHPWLRPYLAERFELQLEALLGEAESLQRDGLIASFRRWRASGERPFSSLFGSRQQRQAFEEIQRLMSLIEGFSDWAMDSVGSQVLDDVAAMRERFEARRDAGGRPLDRLVSRLIGLDLKLEQYRLGERFVSEIGRLGGPAALRRLWEGPASLPSEHEFRHPEDWVRRVGLSASIDVPDAPGTSDGSDVRSIPEDRA